MRVPTGFAPRLGKRAFETCARVARGNDAANFLIDKFDDGALLRDGYPAGSDRWTLRGS